MLVLATTFAAFAAETPTQVSAKPDTAEAAAATREPLTKAEARKIARAYIKENDMPGAQVGKIERSGDKMRVRLQSVEGIPITTLVIDVATGKVAGRG